MTIVDALKAKGATGSTIAEAVTTLPEGGGGGGFELFEDTEVVTMARSGKLTTSQGTEFTIPAWMGEDEILGLTINEGLQEYEIVIPAFTLTIDGTEHTFDHAYFSDAIVNPVYEVDGDARYFLDYEKPEGDQPYIDMKVTGRIGQFGDKVTVSLPAMTIQKVNGDVVKIINNIINANAQ